MALASPGKQHCAKCIGTLSLPIIVRTFLTEVATSSGDAREIYLGLSLVPAPSLSLLDRSYSRIAVCLCVYWCFHGDVTCLIAGFFRQ